MQIMAVFTTLGQFFVLMKKVNIFPKRFRGQRGLQPFKGYLDTLSSGNKGKAVHPGYQWQPEVLKEVFLALHGNHRFKHGPGLFRLHFDFFSRPRKAKDEMGFRIPSNYHGSGRRSENFQFRGKRKTFG